MVGAPREEETARLTGARADFVSGLSRRVDGLRQGLRGVEQSPSDATQRNGLLRRIHALGSASRVLGFASVAEALTEAEKKLRRSEFADVARALDLLPSLVLGVPMSPLPPTVEGGERALLASWPLSVLVFGTQSLVDALLSDDASSIECERTEELGRAIELAQHFGPDLVLIDADKAGARELIESFERAGTVDPVPIVVIGAFASPDAASGFIRLGATRVLPKPVSPDTLQRTVIELKSRRSDARLGQEPLGELSVEALTERIALEVKRGLFEAAESGGRGTVVSFGDGAEVLAAVWGAVARVRELVTLRSSGAVRFDPSGPEGALPIASWSGGDRRGGERGSIAEDADAAEVSLQGRRIVVADDDPAVVWFLAGVLKAVGAEVLEAHDGARALQLTYESWPDLVVSDVLMPKLDGFSLCHEIKRDVAVRDVPVVLLSWKEDLLQRVRELGAPADGYLRKEATAAAVTERLREVLRPRARVERRIAAGGSAKGRLDGLTPRLILELACAGGGNVRLGIRDAVYLYEVQIRQGRIRSAVRSAADGSFERGEQVLAALLGVSAGRFAIEPDVTPCRSDLDGAPAELLRPHVERARRALAGISAGSLSDVTRVTIDEARVAGYLVCTPEPALGLLKRAIAGESPREIISGGKVSPRLLEAVLSDIARRGAVTSVERVSGEALAAESAAQPARISAPPNAVEAPAARPPVPTISEEDAGWFVEEPQAAASAPITATAPSSESSALPFSSQVTPSVDRLWDTITAGAFNEPTTLPGMGDAAEAGEAKPSALPAVEPPRAAAPEAPGAPAAEPNPNATRVMEAVALPRPQPPRPERSATEEREEREERTASQLGAGSDALTAALTGDSSNPPAVSLGGTVIMSRAEAQSAEAQAEPERAQPEPAPAPARVPSKPPSDAPKRVSVPPALPKQAAERPRIAKPKSAAVATTQAQASAASGKTGWFGALVAGLVAALICYGVVSYLKGNVAAPQKTSAPPALPPAGR